MNRITKEMMNGALARYVRACESLGITPPQGHHVQYVEGSKRNGISFKLVYVRGEHGGQWGALGADMNGYLGMTRREAYETISTIARTLEDVAFHNYTGEA